MRQQLTIQDVIRSICIDTHWTVSDARIQYLVQKYTPILQEIIDDSARA